MATLQSSNINISEMDFEGIKNNMKDFFGSQSEFTDHDFSGSGLSIFMDTLSYNSYMMSYYLNMAVKESTLRHAQLRSSITEKAYMLDYTPASIRSARAFVDITIVPENAPSSITIDKHKQFSTTVNNKQYSFVTATSTTILPENGVYIARNVELLQGVPLSFSYTVDKENPDQKFILPNTNTDMETLIVTIKESTTDSIFALYNKATDINEITSTSTIYFINETSDEKFEILFGDGVLGKPLVTGNIVTLTAIVTEGANVNGASTFSISDSISGYSNIVVDTVSISYGGAVRESNESIVFRAPKSYNTQKRSVIDSDYKNILEQNMSGLDSVSSWGGQDNVPPRYGKTFISAKPTGSTALSTEQKTQIKSLLESSNIIAVGVEVVDPDYIDLYIDIQITYNDRSTTKSSGIISDAIKATIQDYKNNNLLKFGSNFEYSVLSRLIDDSDQSIINNLMTISASKTIKPNLNISDSYTIDFDNGIYNPSDIFEGSIVSTAFSYTASNGTIQPICYMDDKGGILRIYYIYSGDKIVLYENIGTVDYVNGTIQINSFRPNAYTGSGISFKITPQKNNLVPTRNQLFNIDDGNITITMLNNEL